MAAIHEDGSADYVEAENHEDIDVVSEQNIREVVNEESSVKHENTGTSDVESEFFDN